VWIDFDFESDAQVDFSFFQNMNGSEFHLNGGKSLEMDRTVY
jgi:hypothetical protein